MLRIDFPSCVTDSGIKYFVVISALYDENINWKLEATYCELSMLEYFLFVVGYVQILLTSANFIFCLFCVIPIYLCWIFNSIMQFLW